MQYLNREIKLRQADIRGVGLIEILVCIGVSIVVLGGALFFYVNSLKENHYVNQLNAAKNYINEVAGFDEIILLYDKDFRINLNSGQNIGSGYCTSYCTSTRFYESFVSQWHRRMKSELSNARFVIDLQDVANAQISIAWENKNFAGSGSSQCLLNPVPDGFVCFTASIR